MSYCIKGHLKKKKGFKYILTCLNQINFNKTTILKQIYFTVVSALLYLIEI